MAIVFLLLYYQSQIIMSYADQIEALWDTSQDKDLTSVMRELLELVDKAYKADEELPLELELDIFLNANYALGFGGTMTEARLLAGLLDRILQGQKQLKSPKVHRLACTLASAMISIMTSDIHHDTRSAHDILTWEKFEKDVDRSRVLGSLSNRLIDSLQYGEFSKWRLELFSFVVTLNLLQEDLGQLHVSETTIDHARQVIQASPRDTTVWKKWENEWLEKSDYYRFVTLMLTNTSVEEEIWLDRLQSYFG